MAVIAGNGCKDMGFRCPELVMRQGKRLIGRMWGDPAVARAVANIAFHQELVKSAHGRIGFKLVGPEGHESVMDAQDFSTFLLQHLREIAEAQMGHKLEGAVITVPAHFNQDSRQATELLSLIHI